ncbi:MAG: hypothetical protein ACI8PW_001607 [Methylophilaceae bacterium]
MGDYQDGIAWGHIIVEVLILITSQLEIVYFGWFYYTIQSKIKLLEFDLSETNQQAQQWRDANRELVAGLLKQILKQFNPWEMTQAEI